jgi:glycosyltransferase involved in cell wall biosynthesis
MAAGFVPGVMTPALPIPPMTWRILTKEHAFPGSLIAADHHPMRIALFTEAYAPQVNGVVRTQVELVRYLNMRGHQVLQVVPYDKTNPRQEQVVEFRSVPFPLYPEMPIILPHWRFHRREFVKVEAFKPDLIHLMSPGVMGYFGRVWARRHGFPVVASYETDIIRYLHYYGFGIFEPLLWRYLRWLFNPCQHTYVPSPVTRDELIKGGIREVRVFERGVDGVQFHPCKRSEAVRDSLGVKPGGALVLYAGRISQEKSLDVLLRAFIRLAVEHPNARLVVTGDGPHRKALVRSFRNPRITFTSWKCGEELAALFASADVFALPSSTETLSLVSMESMASGVPVLAMNAGGVRTVVDHEMTGLLANSVQEFELGLRRLVEDAPLRMRLGLNGRRYAEGKTWSRAFEGLEQNYLEALAAGHKNA